MKKSLWIFAILLLTFLGDRLLGLVLQKQAQNSQFRYARMYDNRAAADILLVGNSRGLIFYQPYIEEITKKETFNLSYNGMPVDLANVFVQDYLDLYPAPKKMVVDVTMCDRVNEQMIGGFNLYTPHSERLSQLMHDVVPTTYNGGKFSYLFRYNSEIFQRNLYYLNKSDEDWLLDRVISDNMVEGAKDLKSYRIDFQPKDKGDYLLDQLNDMVKIAQNKGVDVELVINPYYPDFARSITNMDSLKIAVQNKVGLPVRDYSLAVEDKNGFGDYQHLNKSGAKVFIDRMIEEGVLE